MIIAGGYFQKGMRLKDYWDNLNDEESIAVHAIFFDVLEHLNDRNYPKPELFTVRAWAEFKAAIYSQVEDKDYSYLDFYEI